MTTLEVSKTTYKINNQYSTTALYAAEVMRTRRVKQVQHNPDRKT